MKNLKDQQDKELRAVFEEFNDRYFGGEIWLATTVRFARVFNLKEKEHAADAHYIPNKMLIQIDDHLRGRPRQWKIVLLHEMSHAFVFQCRGYIGNGHDGGHGMTFHADIARLIRAGAYDDLL